jgi:hypothetical protein
MRTISSFSAGGIKKLLSAKKAIKFFLPTSFFAKRSFVKSIFSYEIFYTTPLADTGEKLCH